MPGSGDVEPSLATGAPISTSLVFLLYVKYPLGANIHTAPCHASCITESNNVVAMLGVHILEGTKEVRHAGHGQSRGDSSGV